MLKSFFFCLLVLNLISCQENKKQVISKLSPDRTQFLKAPTSDNEPGIISGQVLNLSDDSAIKGALVTIRKGSRIITTAMTDSEGFFKVIGLPQSHYHVTAEKPDFSSLSFSSVAINPGKEVVTHFILTPVTRIEYVHLSYLRADTLSKDT